ncbi:MAG: hypothetical protein ACRDTF_10625 [Pseudonocardiaceae bacterium]
MSENPLLVTSTGLGGPIVRTSGDEWQWADGLGPLDSGADFVHALHNGEWAEGLLTGASTAIDGLDTVLNPFSAISAAGVGWLLEHVRVFSDMLDALAGSPEDVAATATTWSNIADELRAVADDHARGVSADVADWQGGAAAAYRAAAGNDNEVLAATATAAQALHASVIGAGSVVVMVRGKVCDMIAQAVSELISIALRWAAAAVATLGAAVPGAIAEVAIRVAAWSARIAGWLRRLVQAMRQLGELIEQIGALLGRGLATLDNARPVQLLTSHTVGAASNVDDLHRDSLGEK